MQSQGAMVARGARRWIKKRQKGWTDGSNKYTALTHETRVCVLSETKSEKWIKTFLTCWWVRQSGLCWKHLNLHLNLTWLLPIFSAFLWLTERNRQFPWLYNSSSQNAGGLECPVLYFYNALVLKPTHVVDLNPSKVHKHAALTHSLWKLCSRKLNERTVQKEFEDKSNVQTEILKKDNPQHK